jgi:predicted aldo/keto reductase-like oxidoreductase
MSELGRREFFTRLFHKGAAAVTEPPHIPSLSSLTFPKRQLGSTGEWVPILGLGTAGMGRGIGDDVAAVILNRAVDVGVNLIDTASEKGGYGRAQKQIGRALAGRRKEIFLTTKLFEADGDAARRMLENNLQELRTDHVDLLYVHSLGHDNMDVDVALSSNGVFETVMRAKEEGLTRFVGVTGHSRPERFMRALSNYDMDVIMTAVNFVDVHTYGFEKRIWPFAQRKGLGLLAMKVYGGIKGGGHTPSLLPEEQHDLALRYALSLQGCAAAIVGMVSTDELDENVRRARAYMPLTEGEQTTLLQQGEVLAGEWGAHLGAVE